MNRKEKDLRIVDAFDLDIGDSIKISGDIYKIIKDKDEVKIEDTNGEVYSTSLLLIYDWEKVEPILKDKKCKDNEFCVSCPLRKYVCITHIDNVGEHTLGEVYNAIKKDLDVARLEIFGDEK